MCLCAHVLVCSCAEVEHRVRWMWIDRIVSLEKGRRLVAVKNQDCSAFPFKNDKGEYVEGVILDLDIWIVLPR